MLVIYCICTRACVNPNLPHLKFLFTQKSVLNPFCPSFSLISASVSLTAFNHSGPNWVYPGSGEWKFLPESGRATSQAELIVQLWSEIPRAFQRLGAAGLGLLSLPETSLPGNLPSRVPDFPLLFS